MSSVIVDNRAKYDILISISPANVISHSLLWYDGDRESIRRNTDIPNNQREEIEYPRPVRLKMDRRNITTDDVEYTLDNSKHSYSPRRNVKVYVSTLSDGRNIKVRIQSHPKKMTVVDAFTYK